MAEYFDRQLWQFVSIDVRDADRLANLLLILSIIIVIALIARRVSIQWDSAPDTTPKHLQVIAV